MKLREKLILTSLLLCCSFKPITPVKAYHLTGFAQGTSYHITYYASQLSINKRQIDSVLDKIDSSMSIYKSYSLINAFNTSKQGIKLDEHFKRVMEKSIEIAKISKGTFDVTVFPLVNAWGFGVNKTTSIPDSNGIKSILKSVGYKHLTLHGYFLKKDQPDVQIDVNGIAQGYSVDVLANFLEKKHIQNYLVEVGGEIRVKGQKDNKGPMKIGLEGVDDEDFKPVTNYIQVKQGALTTSGNYRAFYMAGGKKISHLIDPHTGFYVDNDLLSATVYAKDAITADGYDNVLMVFGLKKALKFVESRKDLAAYFIYKDENDVVKDTVSKNFPAIKKIK